MPKLKNRVAVIGGGPAGLMAADVLACAGIAVTIYDRMPSLARKFLLAGRGGLNITHGEPIETFLTRYGEAAEHLGPAIRAFPPQDVRAWCEQLGQPTFAGSSGRVFPQSLKASPLLRAWLRRLQSIGVQVNLRHTFGGWDDHGQMMFRDGEGHVIKTQASATILTLGGGSWPRLGSDGGWVGMLSARGVTIAPLRPANCGFEIDWSPHMRARFAGTPLKNVALSFDGVRVRGECMLSDYGIEGGAVYALSSQLRQAIEQNGAAQLLVDLKPDMSAEVLTERLEAPRGKASLSNHLRKRAGLGPVEIALLHETRAPSGDAVGLAAHIKSLPLHLLRARPIERAISSAGGVKFTELDEHFMLTKMPGVFCAGEMLDWEAPTGGYLLQACLSTGAAAGRGAVAWLTSR